MARIMVVEDDVAIQRLVELILSDLGHEVTLVGDGQEAIKRILEDEPDLVVLDINLPHVDGWEVLHRARRAGRRNTRVVVLTGKSGETDFVMGWRLGVDEYMTKPFDPDKLARVVSETLRMSPEQIRQKRLRELEKANLLLRIESAFGDW